jgi:hypothetical protein
MTRGGVRREPDCAGRAVVRRAFGMLMGAVAACGLLGSASVPARAGTEGVEILVLKEHGVGSPTLVQPYLDRFVKIAATENGWPAATGHYYSNRAAAEAFIDTHHPHYGIFSLVAFLALRQKYPLQVIGEVAVSLAGGRQYYVISKQAANLGGCKGATLASDHLDDADDRRFIERVVARGRFRLDDFKLMRTQRPLQTIKKVLTGEAACALIDDAQLAELPHIEGADGAHAVWQSARLPPMAVAAFAAAPPAERERFRAHLADLCTAAAQSACAEVGIVSLKAADGSDYAAVIAAYGK